VNDQFAAHNTAMTCSGFVQPERPEAVSTGISTPVGSRRVFTSRDAGVQVLRCPRYAVPLTLSPPTSTVFHCHVCKGLLEVWDGVWI
jgi:hypothetical protein